MKTKHFTAALALVIALLGIVMTLTSPHITAAAWPAVPVWALR